MGDGQLVSAIQNGQEVDFASFGNSLQNGETAFVSDHMYSGIGYDSATGDFIVRNPWGTETGQQWLTTFEATMADFYSVNGVLFIASGSVSTGGVNTATPEQIFSISATTSSQSNTVHTGDVVTIAVGISEIEFVTGKPVLQLNDNELATYSSGSGTNTLTFTYTVQSGDTVADLQVTGLNLPSGATIEDQAGNTLSGNVTGDLGIQINVNNAINSSITELYIGYYNRAPDPAGGTYWVGQLQGGMSLSQIAQSYSVQTESTTLYPFLASPNTASTAAVQAFVTSVYENLFNRTPDAAGEAYWVNQLQTGASTVGGAIIRVCTQING